MASIGSDAEAADYKIEDAKRLLTRFFERHAPKFLDEVDARVQTELDFLGNSAFKEDNLKDHIFSKLVLHRFHDAGNSDTLATEEKLHDVYEMYDEDEIPNIPSTVRLFAGHEDKLFEEIACRYHIDDPNLIRVSTVTKNPKMFNDKEFEERLEKECKSNPKVELRFRHILSGIKESNTRAASEASGGGPTYRRHALNKHACCVVS